MTHLENTKDWHVCRYQWLCSLLQHLHISIQRSFCFHRKQNTSIRVMYKDYKVFSQTLKSTLVVCLLLLKRGWKKCQGGDTPSRLHISLGVRPHNRIVYKKIWSLEGAIQNISSCWDLPRAELNSSPSTSYQTTSHGNNLLTQTSNSG